MQAKDETTLEITEEISNLNTYGEILDEVYYPIYEEKLNGKISKECKTIFITSKPPAYSMRNNLAYALHIILENKQINPDITISNNLTLEEQEKWNQVLKYYFGDQIKIEEVNNKQEEDNVSTLKNLACATILKQHSPQLVIPNVTFFASDLKNLPNELQVKLTGDMQKEIKKLIIKLKDLNEEFDKLQTSFKI